MCGCVCGRGGGGIAPLTHPTPPFTKLKLRSLVANHPVYTTDLFSQSHTEGNTIMLKFTCFKTFIWIGKKTKGALMFISRAGY